MKKTELRDAIASKTGLTITQAGQALQAFIDIAGEELAKGETVQLTGFGTFDVKERAGRTGRNPRTGETITIKASKSVGFKAGKALKDKDNA